MRPPPAELASSVGRIRDHGVIGRPPLVSSRRAAASGAPRPGSAVRAAREPGLHEVVLHANGFDPTARSVRGCRDVQRTRLSLTMRQSRSEPATRAPSAAAASSTPPEPQKGSTRAVPDAEPRKARLHRSSARSGGRVRFRERALPEIERSEQGPGCREPWRAVGGGTGSAGARRAAVRRSPGFAGPPPARVRSRGRGVGPGGPRAPRARRAPSRNAPCDFRGPARPGSSGRREPRRPRARDRSPGIGCGATGSPRSPQHTPTGCPRFPRPRRHRGNRRPGRRHRPASRRGCLVAGAAPTKAPGHPHSFALERFPRPRGHAGHAGLELCKPAVAEAAMEQRDARKAHLRAVTSPAVRVEPCGTPWNGAWNAVGYIRCVW